MLKQLFITNIILIEFADLHFEPGFNILSGETGSGKSAIMAALSLLAGERAESSLIRQGTDKGVVEGSFDISQIPGIAQLLESAGIDHDPSEYLIIKRELYGSGKSRAYINNQMTQLTLLKKIAEPLLEIVGQHANQKLFFLENHRHILDIYGQIEEEVKTFQESWTEENGVREKLNNLIHNEAQRLREIEVCLNELEELREANFQEGEEETLFADYSRLANAEEIGRKTEDICQGLQGERNGVLAILHRQKHILENVLQLDPSLSEIAQSFQEAILELQEVSYCLRNYQARVECNPLRFQEVQDRLTLIDRLKRKYGPTISDVFSYRTKTEEKLKTLERADDCIEEYRVRLQMLCELNDKRCHHLTKLRNEAGPKLEEALELQLRTLNMGKAEFKVEIAQQKRTQSGDDKIEFYFIPNVGEGKIPIRECASGGELSRVMLALQTLLAGKEKIPIIVFDEIDANIGGETASIVGDKLLEIGTSHQVLCISHFPQVAQKARHHIQITKVEKQGRTVTIVQHLSGEMREKELARMYGIHHSSMGMVFSNTSRVQ
jgi:DNA repair protein RecN (Recombination protein N)